MALTPLGFEREAGTGRGYINRINHNYPIGARLSRRQYDKFVESQRALHIAPPRKAVSANWESGAARGQRRYKTALEAYSEQLRLQGIKLNKNQIRTSAQFKEILKALKGETKKNASPAVKRAARELRTWALSQLGGDDYFRRQYDSLYGAQRPGAGWGMLPNGRSRRAA